MVRYVAGTRMIIPNKGDAIDWTLRRLKKAVADAGILRDYLSHTEFIKPCERRRRKSMHARRRVARSQ